METFDWSTLLTGIIPQALIDNRGKNVKLALIDTGANLSVKSLTHLDKPGHKFFVGRQGFSILDLSGRDPVTDGFSAGGHGTQLACIMGGKANPNIDHHVDGIANEADIYIFKARDISGNITEMRHLLDSIELAAELGIEIAVTAQALTTSRMRAEGVTQAEIDRVFKKAEDANMVIFAATENRSTGGNWSNVVSRRFPNNQPGVINIASAPSDINSVRNQINGQDLQFLLGGFKGMVYNSDGSTFILESSNSSCVAILGSIAALCLSALKAAPGFNPPGSAGMITELAKLCKPLTDANGTYTTPSLYKNA